MPVPMQAYAEDSENYVHGVVLVCFVVFMLLVN